MAEASAPVAIAGRPRGIGGWLLVPAANLVLVAAGGLYALADLLASPQMLTLALTHEAWITVDFLGTVLFWIGLPAAGLVLLLLRSRHFPKAMPPRRSGSGFSASTSPGSCTPIPSRCSSPLLRACGSSPGRGTCSNPSG